MGSATWMIYGATGYTGELAAREAVARGARPILAGRDGERVRALAGELGLEGRSFPLDDPHILARGLEGVAAVLHCAGPFARTSRPVVDACLAGGVHYLDITGEIPVFERILGLDEVARRSGVVLLPGTGFDVVPTDCLAARLAEALPDACELALAFHSDGGGASRGTLRTMVEALPAAGAIRRDGRLAPVPVAWDAREIEFTCGPRWTMTIPWGDLSTAWRTTRIPNIRVYTGLPPRAIRRLRRWRVLLPLLALGPVKRFLLRRIARRPAGPDAVTRRTARACLWGEVSDGGESVSATLDTPEAYAFTATAAVECARRVLEGRVGPGAWTPATAFGPGFAAELPGVVEGPIYPSPTD